jgi:hypothetical protein
VINTGTDSQIIGELQMKVEQDRIQLASMNRSSPAYRQLRRQTVRNAARLRALETDARVRADQVIMLRFSFTMLGGIAVLAGWGSWKMLIGLGVAAFGVWVADRLPDHLYRTGLGCERRAKTGGPKPPSTRSSFVSHWRHQTARGSALAP